MGPLPVTALMLAQLARRKPVSGARSAFIGVSAALRARFWVSGPRLRSVLETELSPTSTASHVPDPELVVALRIANGTMRHLSRTGSGWRNTCLYRSMAQYLVLRTYGRSAAVRIGVNGQRPHYDEGTMTAHSWVIYDGPEPVQDGGEGYEELRFRQAAGDLSD